MRINAPPLPGNHGSKSVRWGPNLCTCIGAMDFTSKAYFDHSVKRYPLRTFSIGLNSRAYILTMVCYPYLTPPWAPYRHSRHMVAARTLPAKLRTNPKGPDGPFGPSGAEGAVR